MEVPHDVYYTNLCYPPGDPAYNSSSAPYMSTYTNFFNPGPCNNKHMPSTDSHYNYNSPAPVNFGYSSTQAAGETINRDIETLRHDLAFKCPRSNDLLIAITKTADAAVQEHRTTDDEDDDEEDDDDPRPPRLVRTAGLHAFLNFTSSDFLITTTVVLWGTVSFVPVGARSGAPRCHR